MNSIYIESEKILARKDIVEWLDGCGATWGDCTPFNLYRSTYQYLKFRDGFFYHSNSINDNGIHCQTPEQFCELIAESLGIDKPVFGEGISKKETTTEPIKGMAIEVSRLSEEDKKHIESIRDHKWDWDHNWKYCVIEQKWHVYASNSSLLEAEDLTITESPKVFMEYVAQQTGKEYKATISKMETVEHVNNSYKFKTYRILDSLDGIPLDTRFKLSEFPLPPFDKEVMFIIKGNFFRASVGEIKQNVICLHGAYKGHGNDYLRDLDGEWMRIV